MIFGYARVSTDAQNLDTQTDALERAGAGRVFADRISGSLRQRPELDRMLDRMLDQLRPGDVVMVTRYDRPARSLRDLLDIAGAIAAKGAAPGAVARPEGRGCPDARRRGPQPGRHRAAVPRHSPQTVRRA